MFKARKRTERKFRRRKLVGIDPIKKIIRVCPREVVGIADSEDVGVVLFRKGMNLFIP